MKLKLLYGLGAITTIAPLVAVVSCGCTSNQKAKPDSGTENPNPPTNPDGGTTPPVDPPIEPEERPNPPTEEPEERPNPPTEEPEERPTPPIEEPEERPNPPTEEPEERPTPPIEEPEERPIPPIEEPEERPTPPIEEPDSKSSLMEGLRKYGREESEFNLDNYNLDYLNEFRYLEERDNDNGFEMAALLVDNNEQFRTMNNIERFRRFLIRNAGKKVVYVIVDGLYGGLLAKPSIEVLDRGRLNLLLAITDQLRDRASERYGIDYEKAPINSRRYKTTFTAFTKGNKLIFDQRLDHDPVVLSLYWPGNPLDLIKYERYDFQVEIIRNFLEKYKGQKVSIGLVNIDEGIEQYHALHEFTVPSVLPNTITEFVNYVNSNSGDNGTYANAEDLYKSFD